MALGNNAPFHGSRVADERRFLSEALSAVLGEEKGQSARLAIEALAPVQTEGDPR